MKPMQLYSFLLVTFFLTTGFLGADGASPAEKRKNIQTMQQETLSELYSKAPHAKTEIQKAAGYAVFSNVGVNLILLSAGTGYGVAHDNASGKDTYMKMASGGVGLGLGVKDFRGVFVFESKEKLDFFINKGWEASAQADAAAQSGDKGGSFTGAVTVAPGVHLYQLTKNGLAIQATIQGTKYWKDDELN